MAGDEVHSSGSTQEIVELAEALSAHVYGSSAAEFAFSHSARALAGQYAHHRQRNRQHHQCLRCRIYHRRQKPDHHFVQRGRGYSGDLRGVSALGGYARAWPHLCHSPFGDGDIKLSLHELLPKLKQRLIASTLAHQRLLVTARDEREKEWQQQEERLAAERLRPALSPMVAAGKSSDPFRRVPPSLMRR